MAVSKESEYLDSICDDVFMSIVNKKIDEYEQTLKLNKQKAVDDVVNEWEIIVKTIIKNVISDWYSKYTPSKYYHRKDRLYKSIKVIKSGTSVTYDLDFSLYGEDNDYVENLVYEEGWHGGLKTGKGHPDGKTPWYSYVKDNGWRVWLRPAKQSFSIKEQIDEKINTYDMKDIYDNVIKKYF